MKIFCILLIFSNLGFAKSIDQNNLDFFWHFHTSDKQLNFSRLLGFLELSNSGKELIAKARQKAALKSLLLEDILKVAEGSMTDTTITRRFHRSNPLEVVHDSSSVIYINKNLSTKDALLDLAHELTHYVYREPFNPYVSSFRLDEFIQNTIDGKGGEVEAFIAECKLSLDLEIDNNHKCENYRTKDALSNGFDRDLVSADFYKLGPFYEDFAIKLGEIESKKIKARQEKVVFYSSAYSMPYPLASVLEFQSIVSSACENDHKRISFIQSAAEKTGNLRPSMVEVLVRSFKKRCKDFLQVN
jgi:hypothetical protein